MNPKEHWEKVYLSKPSTEVSWYQARLTKSLELIVAAGIEKKARIIDVGGGASTLAEDLLANGYYHLTVLDISSEALNQSKKRLGEKSKKSPGSKRTSLRPIYLKTFLIYGMTALFFIF